MKSNSSKEKSMLVVVEESGDCGLKMHKGTSAFVHGTSTHFFLLILVFENTDVAKIVELAISNFKSDINWHKEFKFSNCPNKIKNRFFEHILPYLKAGNFSIRCVAVDKKQLISTRPDIVRTAKSTQLIYKLCLTTLFNSYPLARAEVILDGVLPIHDNLEKIKNEFNSQAKDSEQENYQQQKDSQQENMIEKFETRDSKSSNLIQLADMIVGAIARSYNPALKNSDHWLKMLNLKDEDIIEII